MLYSFIVDNHPKFHLQAYYLLATLTQLGNVKKEQITVHYAGEIPENFKKIIADRFNIGIRQVERLNHPYCHKILQLETFLDANEDVVLFDCDTAITRPVPWPEVEAVAAKRVDTASPPRSIMQEIFKNAGLKINWSESDCLPGHEGRDTPAHNYNGGVYLLRSGVIPRVYGSWKKWANFCMDRQDLFGQYSMHIDQVAFALSMTELGLPVHTLNREFNFPTHLSLPPDFDCDPYILHYHWMLDDQQLLKSIGHIHVDARIAQVNNFILEDRKTNFNNRIFWDFRYATDPAKGSGVGSRGVVLSVKRSLLQCLLDAGRYKSVLDVGCGDLETTRMLAGDFTYLGLDSSVEALKLAQQKRNDWNFLEFSRFPADVEKKSYDLVICLDVLIHQPSKSDYDKIVDMMANATCDTLVVSGYDDDPAFTSSLTYYYEPISKSIRKTGIFSEMFTVGRYRDVSVIVAKKRSTTSHFRDMLPENVNDVAGWTRSPLVFRELLDFSRSRIGFFPNHTPRAVEYTWIIDECAKMPAIKTVLDVGAGVSCLPLFLAMRGKEVITVDGSSYIRRLDQHAQWNEWGFLDYSQFDPRITSINSSFEAAAIDKKVDMIYSVSVIEHLSTAARKIWIKRMRSLLNPGGRILLTVDLVPPNDDLWIFAEGKVVEENHGTFKTLCNEIRSEDFSIDYVQVLKAIPGTRVDIGLIAASLI